MADSTRPSNRILIVRLGALGDIVHAIPVAAALRRAFPRRAHRLAGRAPSTARSSIWCRCSIDGWSINDRGDARGGASLIGRDRASCARARYDVAIDLQGLIKSAVLARASGARARDRLLDPRYAARAAGAARSTPTSHDPGGGGIVRSARTRHVVDDQPRAARAARRSASPRRSFRSTRVDSAAARRDARATGGRYALLNPARRGRTSAGRRRASAPSRARCASGTG